MKGMFLGILLAIPPIAAGAALYVLVHPFAGSPSGSHPQCSGSSRCGGKSGQ